MAEIITPSEGDPHEEVLSDSAERNVRILILRKNIARISLFVGLTLVIAYICGGWEWQRFILLASIFAGLITGVGFYLYDVLRARGARAVVRVAAAYGSRFSLFVGIFLVFAFVGTRWSFDYSVIVFAFLVLTAGFGFLAFLWGVLVNKSAPKLIRGRNVALYRVIFWSLFLVFWSVYLLLPILLGRAPFILLSLSIWLIPASICVYFLQRNIRALKSPPTISLSEDP